MKKYFYSLIIFLCFNFPVFSQEIQMSGTVIDLQTNTPIEFVNIGVLNKNKGTVSNQKGNFSISLPNDFVGDSLTISHVSYETLKILIKNSINLKILLQPRIDELLEVVITNEKKKSKKIGVRSHNPLLWLGAISEDNDIIENAQRINIPNEKTAWVKHVNIYLRNGFESDSCFIRINFYKNIDNYPGEKIVHENIIQNKRIRPGWIEIDLTNFHVYIEEDFFVGIEFIPDFKKPREVYMGAILAKGKGYSRRSSQGKWNKLHGASTINVEVEY